MRVVVFLVYQNHFDGVLMDAARATHPASAATTAAASPRNGL
jgi:hypothetical protein